MRIDTPIFKASSAALSNLNVLAAIGGLTVVLGLMFWPQRTWSNLLVVGMFLVGIGLAGLLFVAIHYVSGGGWWVALRRVPEALSNTLLPSSIFMAIVVILGVSLYPWNGMSFHGDSFWFKEGWLQTPFFILRTVFYIVVWMLFTRAILNNIRKQDVDGDPKLTTKNRLISAGFIIVFALTFSLASFDWVMSLEPYWFSTMFGVYNFAGLFLSGLAAITLTVLWLMKEGGPLHGVINKSHLHDLGSLIFGFSSFWGYIWYCQYMLIWYSNIPEETTHFAVRMGGLWEPIFFLNFALNWAVPFLALMPRYAKHDTSWMAKICIVVLIGRWFDLYLMIMPQASGDVPLIGPVEIGILLGGIGFFGLVLAKALAKAPLVPANDPFLQESLHHHR